MLIVTYWFLRGTKESDVEMLVTSIQSTDSSDAAHLFTKHRDKVHVGINHGITEAVW